MRRSLLNEIRVHEAVWTMNLVLTLSSLSLPSRGFIKIQHGVDALMEFVKMQLRRILMKVQSCSYCSNWGAGNIMCINTSSVALKLPLNSSENNENSSIMLWFAGTTYKLYRTQLIIKNSIINYCAYYYFFSNFHSSPHRTSFLSWNGSSCAT